MTDMDMSLLIDLHKNNKRQWPGSDADTLRALSFIKIEKNKTYKIADIGCGTGHHTVLLAKSIDSNIVAVDLFSDFLDKLEQNAKSEWIQNNIKTLNQSMDNLQFGEEEFDIIWSEGAIYNMWFENGIKNRQKFIKKDWYIVISEITRLTNQRPSEINNHRNTEYPEIDTASQKIKILEDNGFVLSWYFYLSEDSRIQNYYKSLEDNLEWFLQRHDYSQIAKNIVQWERQEIQLYKKYKDYFSYGFYIARKFNKG